MSHLLMFGLAATAVVVLVDLVATRTGLPSAALLTIAGLVYAVLPGPNVELVPEVVLTFVLPPLLYSAALNSSPLAIRRNLAAIVSLSVVLVLLTALLVGLAVSLVVPAVTLAAGIALGAAVAPPDPVAALAVGRRAGLPRKLITLVEGEGLLNDATALTTLTVAVAATTSGDFSFGTTAWRFAAVTVGGAFVGAVIARVVRWIRLAISDPLLVNSISLATPFAAYLLAEEIGGSGVLAVVIAGLMIGHDASGLSSASRLQASAVWRLVDFLLEGFVFLLIGQQLPTVLRGLRDYPTAQVWAAAGASVGVVLLLRPLWLICTDLLPRQLHLRLGGTSSPSERRLSRPEVVALSWAGTRGVITLAAIFSLPIATDAGAPFPGRDLLLFCAYVVVVVTLVGQGMTFAPLIRVLKLRANPADDAQLRNQARQALVEAALAQLDAIAESERLDAAAVERLRWALAQRASRYRTRVQLLETAEDSSRAMSDPYERALRARRRIIEVERAELMRWRDSGMLPEPSLRVLQTELDHEENMLIRGADR